MSEGYLGYSPGEETRRKELSSSGPRSSSVREDWAFEMAVDVGLIKDERCPYGRNLSDYVES